MRDDIFENEHILRRPVSVRTIFGAGFLNVSEARESRIKYPAFCLIFCDKGEIKTYFSGKEVVLSEGKTVLFAPDTEFVLRASSEKVRVFFAVFGVKENSVSVFCGKPTVTSGFAKTLLIKLGRTSDEYFDKTHGCSLTNLPEVKNDVNVFTEQSLRLLTELFIIECIKPAYKSIISDVSDNDAATESQKITANIYAYLTNHVSEKISLDDLSEALYFSNSYVKKVFKKETGRTVMQAFTELKIEEAKKLIASGKPFNEIAEELSFSSKNYFSTVFKSVTGMTPSDYKKTL